MNSDQHRAMTNAMRQAVVSHTTACYQCKPYDPSTKLSEVDNCIAACREAHQIARDVYWQHAGQAR